MAKGQRPKTNDEFPMALIVIGGHSRNVGKTSVVAGLIAALPEYNWTAFKITQHGEFVFGRWPFAIRKCLQHWFLAKGQRPATNDQGSTTIS